MWPIISNRDVLAVNQRWAGHPGTRLGYTGAVNGNVGNSSQTWAKPLGNTSFAVLFMSTGPGESPHLRPFCSQRTNRSRAVRWATEPANFSLPIQNVSGHLTKGGGKICVRDLYTKAESGPLDATLPLTAVAAPHDSVFLCVRPAVGGGCASHGGCPAYPA